MRRGFELSANTEKVNARPPDTPGTEASVDTLGAWWADAWQAVVGYFAWPTATLEEQFERDRRAAIAQLSAEPYASIIKSEIPQLLLDENKGSGQAKIEAVRTLDGKALTFAGVAATVIGLFASLGSHGPWALLGLLPLLVAVLCFLIGGFVRTDWPPAPEQYVVPSVLKGDDGTSARLKAALAMAWSVYSKELARTSAIKGFWVRWGALLLLVGLVALIVVTIVVPAPAPK